MNEEAPSSSARIDDDFRKFVEHWLSVHGKEKELLTDGDRAELFQAADEHLTKTYGVSLWDYFAAQQEAGVAAPTQKEIVDFDLWKRAFRLAEHTASQLGIDVSILEDFSGEPFIVVYCPHVSAIAYCDSLIARSSVSGREFEFLVVAQNGHEPTCERRLVIRLSESEI